MVVAFLVMRVAPGDPALLLAGDDATPEAIEAFREKLGLNGSLLQQFWDYFRGLLQGDLGKSIFSSQPVADIIADSMPVTLAFIALAMTLSLGLSFLLAVPTAMHRFGFPGMTFKLVTSTLLSIPVFFSGQVIILIVAINWKLLPVGGFDPADPLRYLILPAITACGPLVPVLLRVLQSSVVDTMGQGFVEAAQVRGIQGLRLVWRYLLRPSLAPTIALSTYIIGTLFASAVVLEQVFNLPGAATRLIGAVFTRDYPVVQGVVLVIGIMVVAINLAGDLAIGWLDPRARQKL
jgi:ABC-type dipeptide/oligopeptide/nickel transport system permease component